MAGEYKAVPPVAQKRNSSGSQAPVITGQQLLLDNPLVWRKTVAPMRKVAFLAGLCLFMALTGPLSVAAVIYPQIAVGGGCETVVTITNPAGTGWSGRLIFKKGNEEDFSVPLKADGILFGPDSTWQVAAGSTARYVITSDGAQTAGYLRIETLSGPPSEQLVTGIFFRIRDVQGRVTDLAATYPIKPARRLVFPVEKGATSDTGIALLPAGPQVPGRPITFRLINQAGSLVQEVQPGFTGHMAKMAGEIFDKLPPAFLGSMVIDSPIDLYLLVLRLDMSGPSVQLTGTMPSAVPGTLSSPVKVLPFRVVDAEYSKALDRIIAVAADPHRLYIYDPVAGTSKSLNLAGAPSCVSVGPDGKYACVGHNSSISYVNLVDQKVEKTIPVSAEVGDIVLAGNGYAYAIPANSQWDDVRNIKLSTGEETLTYGSLYGSKAKLQPGGQAIYTAYNGLSPSDVLKLDISAGPAAFLYDSPYHGDYSIGEDLWFSEDGQRLFTRPAGTVVRLSDVREHDLQYNWSLGVPIEHMSHSSVTNRIAVVPRQDPYAPVGASPEIRIFEGQLLDLQSRWFLPSFVSDRLVRAQGRFVFYSVDGSKVFVIVQADTSAGLLNDFGILVADAAGLE